MVNTTWKILNCETRRGTPRVQDFLLIIDNQRVKTEVELANAFEFF